MLFFTTTSPAGDWLIGVVQPAEGADVNYVNTAFPTAGGSPFTLCSCDVDWTPNGKSLVIRLGVASSAPPTKTFVVALESGTTLPPLPAHGIRSREDLNNLPVTREIDGWIYPSDTGSAYVFTRNTTQRNIHRVPLP